MVRTSRSPISESFRRWHSSGAGAERGHPASRPSLPEGPPHAVSARRRKTAFPAPSFALFSFADCPKFPLDISGKHDIILVFSERERSIAELCKGSTTDSGSVCEGSNPSSAAMKKSVFCLPAKGAFFSYIRLRRVLLRCSYIRPSDELYCASRSLKANII